MKTIKKQIEKKIKEVVNEVNKYTGTYDLEISCHLGGEICALYWVLEILELEEEKLKNKNKRHN